MRSEAQQAMIETLMFYALGATDNGARAKEALAHVGIRISDDFKLCKSESENGV